MATTYDQLVQGVKEMVMRAGWTLNDSKRGTEAMLKSKPHRLASMMEWNGEALLEAGHLMDMAEDIATDLADFAFSNPGLANDAAEWDRAAEDIAVHYGRMALRTIATGVNTGSGPMRAVSEQARVRAAVIMAKHIGVHGSSTGGFDDDDLRAVLASRAERERKEQARLRLVPRKIMVAKAGGQFVIDVHNSEGELLLSKPLPGVTTKRDATARAKALREMDGYRSAEVV